MTTRRPRKPQAAKAENPTQENEYKIPQQELEEFFTDPEPKEEEEKIVEKAQQTEAPKERKRVRPPKTGKVFLGKEEMREWDSYVSWLQNEQGLKKVRHKKI